MTYNLQSKNINKKKNPLPNNINYRKKLVIISLPNSLKN